MLSSYVLIVDIVASNPTIDEEQFRVQVEPCLAHLTALKGAFDRSPCTTNYYPPDAQSLIPDNEFWSTRSVVMISLGKKRAEYLVQLYDAIAQLITLELTDFEVRSEVKKLEFS